MKGAVEVTESEIRQREDKLYEKTLRDITESCERAGVKIPADVRCYIAGTYAATITIRELLIDKCCVFQ